MLDVAEDRLSYMRRPETDMEIVCSWHTVESFALGNGIWQDLPLKVRLEQLERIIDLADELYPTFRWFLYDGARYYSIPFTVFGQRRVAIYTGGMYLVFTGTPEIQLMSRYFDDLLRASSIQPVEIAAFAKTLRARVKKQGE